jgi:hypothetical protein
MSHLRSSIRDESSSNLLGADAVSEERDHVLNSRLERLEHLEGISHQVQLGLPVPISQRNPTARFRRHYRARQLARHGRQLRMDRSAR